VFDITNLKLENNLQTSPAPRSFLMKIFFIQGKDNLSMQATNALCSLNAPTCEALEAPPLEENDSATVGAQDVGSPLSTTLDIKQEVLRLADHMLYAIPVHITLNPRG
jgi:hypothetical protein